MRRRVTSAGGDGWIKFDQVSEGAEYIAVRWKPATDPSYQNNPSYTSSDKITNYNSLGGLGWGTYPTFAQRIQLYGGDPTAVQISCTCYVTYSDYPYAQNGAAVANMVDGYWTLYQSDALEYYSAQGFTLNTPWIFHVVDMDVNAAASDGFDIQYMLK